MKRKLVSLLCVISMMAAVLSGCGNSPKEEGSSAEPSKEETQNSTEKSGGEDSSESVEGDLTEGELEYVELTWDVLTYQPNNIKDKDMIQAALDEYFMEKLNCKVVLNAIDVGTFREKVPTKLMSGEEMDLVTIYGDMSYSNYSDMGVFYPIDTLWDEYGTDVKSLFSEGVWESLRVNGHIYGVPVLKDNCYIIGYTYNKDLADALDLDMQQEWSGFRDMEDFMMQAIALRDEQFPEYQGMPLMSSSGGACPYWVSIERFGCGELAVCNIPGKEEMPEYGTDTVYNYLESDAFRELCLMKQRLVESGVLAYDYSIYETRVQEEPSTLLNLAWGYTWIDENLYGDCYSTGLTVFDDVWTEGGNYTSAMIGIGANSKNPERAMMVIDLVNNDSYIATLLRFGIEGEHWEKDGDGKMQLANRNADVANPGWLQWYGPFYGNLTIVDAPESYGGPDGIMLEKMAEYNDEAILAAHMGFVLDVSEIDNEISACNNVLGEYYGNLVDGKMESPEAVNQAIDEMIAKLKENGSERIVAEVQRQIDEWAASK